MKKPQTDQLWNYGPKFKFWLWLISQQTDVDSEKAMFFGEGRLETFPSKHAKQNKGITHD